MNKVTSAQKRWGVAAVDNEVGAGMSDDRLKRPRIKSTVVASHFPTVFMFREYEGGDALNRKLEELMLRLEKETTTFPSAPPTLAATTPKRNLFRARSRR